MDTRLKVKLIAGAIVAGLAASSPKLPPNLSPWIPWFVALLGAAAMYVQGFLDTGVARAIEEQKKNGTSDKEEEVASQP